MKKAFCAFAVILCAFGIYRLAFRPVSVSLPDGCDSVSISTYGAVDGRYAVTDAGELGRWMKLLDSHAFRKSYRLSNEAPENLWAEVQFQSGGRSVADLILSANPYGDGGTVYLWNGGEERTACGAELYRQVSFLIEKLDTNE